MTHIDHSGKMFVMRVFIAAIILIFSFQSPSQADDIRDFQIEGMSIGDSTLDFFSEEEIKNNLKLQYFPYIKDKKFILAEFYKFPFFQTYDSLQIIFKNLLMHHQNIHLHVYPTNLQPHWGAQHLLQLFQVYH